MKIEAPVPLSPPRTGRRLRVLFMLHSWPPESFGGTERYVARLAKELRDRGTEVRLIVGSQEGAESPRLQADEWEGFPVLRVQRSGVDLEAWERSNAPEVEGLIRRVLTDYEPDLVHVHHWLRLTRSLVALCHGLSVPTVVTLHDTWTSCPRVLRIREDGSFCRQRTSLKACGPCAPRAPGASERDHAEQHALFAADHAQELALAGAVVAPSRAHARLLGRVGALDPAQVTVLPHGTLSDEMPPALPHRPEPFARVRIAHWGLLSDFKGTVTLLEACLALAPELRARLVLKLLGPADSPAISDLIERAGETLCLTHTPSFEPADLVPVLADADWAALPSLASESHGFVLDEAFRSGLPVIASRHGALEERVAGAGLLVAPGDRAAWTKALRRCVEEPELAASLAERIPALGSVADHVDRLEALYQSVLRAGPPSPPSMLLRERHRQARSLRIEEDRQRLQRLQNELAGETVRANALKGTVQDTLRSIEEYKVAKEALAQQLAAVEADRQRLSEVQANYQRSVETLSGNLEKKGEDLKEAYGRVGKQAERAEGAEEQLRAARRELQEALGGLRSAKALVRSLEGREQRLGVALAAVEDRERAARQTIASVQRDLDRAEGARATQQERADGLQSAHEKLERRRAEERKASEARLEGAKALEKRLRAVEKELGEHRSALDRERSLRTDTEQRVRELGRFAKGSVQDLSDLERGLQAEREGMLQLGVALQRVSAEARYLHEERERIDERLQQELALRGELRGSRLYRLVERRARKSVEREAIAARGHHLPETKVARPAGPDARDDDGRLTILLVIHQFLPRHSAGSEIYTYKLAKALSARHRVHLVFTEAHPDVPSYHVREGEYEGLPFTEISSQHWTEWFERTYRDPRMERLFEGILERVQPDLVHLQHTTHHSIGYVSVAKRFGVPVAYTLHEYMLLCPRGGQMRRADGEVCEKPIATKCADCITQYRLGTPPEDVGAEDQRASLPRRVARHLPDPVRSWLGKLVGPKQRVPTPEPEGSPQAADFEAAIERRLEDIGEVISKVDLFISPSEFLRDTFIASGMIQPAQIIYSDNGQDPTPFDGVSRRKRPAGEVRVGYIGTIAEYKGVHVLVEAMNALQDLDGLHLDIHGCLKVFADYTEELQAQSENPRTTFHGRYDQKRVGAILGAFDCIVVPSLWYENSPLTIHEAYMAGVPVIASDFGGMAEFVHEEKNGLHFRVGDAKHLAKVIRRLVTEEGLLDGLSNTTVPIKTIAEDAEAMEGRYVDLVAGRTPKA